jgi:hypothetical protein
VAGFDALDSSQKATIEGLLGKPGKAPAKAPAPAAAAAAASSPRPAAVKPKRHITQIDEGLPLEARPLPLFIMRMLVRRMLELFGQKLTRI